MPVFDNLKETAPIKGNIDISVLGIPGCWNFEFDLSRLIYFFPCGLTIANGVAFLMSEDYKKSKLFYQLVHLEHHKHMKSNESWSIVENRQYSDGKEIVRTINCDCSKGGEKYVPSK